MSEKCKVCQGSNGFHSKGCPVQYKTYNIDELCTKCGIKHPSGLRVCPGITTIPDFMPEDWWSQEDV